MSANYLGRIKGSIVWFYQSLISERLILAGYARHQRRVKRGAANLLDEAVEFLDFALRDGHSQ